MQVQSKFDKDTHYIVTNGYVRICREGDKMTISMVNIPEQSKRFRPEIQEELMAIWTEKHPLIPCEFCGKMFHKGIKRRYCSQECGNEAKRKMELERIMNQKQTCSWCGETFIGCNSKLYCSPECKQKGKGGKTKAETLKTWESHLQEKLQLAESKGMTYAEMHQQETLKMVGKVVI